MNDAMFVKDYAEGYFIAAMIMTGIAVIAVMLFGVCWFSMIVLGIATMFSFDTFMCEVKSIRDERMNR